MSEHLKLAERIERHVAERHAGTVSVHELQPLAGGACQEAFRVDLIVDGEERTFVLRSDATHSLPGSLSRAHEFPIIQAATEAGVATPAVCWLAEDLAREGASAYFMDWAEGIALGRKIVAGEKLAGQRPSLPKSLARELALIHRVPTQALPLDGHDDAALRALAMHESAIAELEDAAPVLELGVRWLRQNKPAPKREVLCHGDYRTGNYLVDDNGLSAVLDWEFAHLGPPEDDLGWLSVRDWRFGELDKAAFGLCSMNEFLDHYAEAGGCEIRREDIHYWQIMGNLRWAIGAHHQGLRFRRGTDDIELYAIGERAIEIEYEILRLIEGGAP